MKPIRVAWAVALVVLSLAGCGDGGPEANRGTLNKTTPVITAGVSSTIKTQFASTYASLASALQYMNTGMPTSTPAVNSALPCDFNVFKINYNTVGAVGEAATATAAVMVPTATNGNPACEGPKYPVVLAAHGTSTNKALDLSSISANNEGTLYAAIFAAQGYVVVAPNYAGYDQSNLSYHPYLILAQQSKDMQDALSAAKRTGLFSASDKLFVTGYSQGGAVAVATQRDLEASGVKVTASAPGSGPYAMLSFGDTIFAGKPNRGGTIFTPLLIDAAQKAYGNIYSTPSDIYSGTFAGTVTGLLPGLDVSLNPKYLALAATNLLPSNPDGSEAMIPFIGSNALITTSTRTAYNADAQAHAVATDLTLPTGVSNPLRQALLKNDLRSGWVPKAPTQLCGSDNDPSVFWENTTRFQAYVNGKVSPNTVSILNLNAAITGAADPYAALKTAFVASGLNIGFNSALISTTTEVHSGIAPFCYMGALGMFKSL